MNRLRMHSFFIAALAAVFARAELALGESGPPKFVTKPGLYKSITEPPCSYASTQNRKGFIKPDDRVIAWVRGAHNGGAIPLRHFLSAPRVVNDTYGLFFYDPDGGYVAAYEKDYGYEFQGWRGGVMIAKGRDGTLWNALSGIAIEGPLKGKKLKRVPSFTTDWAYWLMLHPESTVYDLFDGKKYEIADLPSQLSEGAAQSMGKPDARLDSMRLVLGVETAGAFRAFPLDETTARGCWMDDSAGGPIAVFWYGPTKSSTAYRAVVDEKPLTFYADDISPETAPFKDKETGTRWSLAGRGIDGPHRGRELEWIDSIQCRWYAWSAEHPETSIFKTK